MATVKDKVARRTWSLKIHGHRWDIFVMPHEELQKEWGPTEVNGLTDADNYRIIVTDKIYGKVCFIETLWHEVTHAILTYLTSMDKYDEELIAETMGRELPNIVNQFATLPKGWKVDKFKQNG